MIKINLVKKASKGQNPFSFSFGKKTTEETSPESLDQAEARKQGLIRLLIVIIFPIAIYFYEQQSLPVVSAQLLAKQKQFNELQLYNTKSAGSVSEIKKFKEDRTKLQKQIDIIEGLSKNKYRDIKALEAIQLGIPEKVWLSRVEVVNGKLIMQGLAFSDFEVSQFIDTLTRSIFFADVNLVSSSEQTVDGNLLKKFEIICGLEKI